VKLKLSIPIFIIVSLSSFLLFTLFRLKTYNISNNTTCLPQDNLLQDLEVFHKNIFFLNTEQLVEKIKLKYPCVRESKIRKVLPSKVEISLELDEPVAKIGSKNLVITSEGLVIGAKEEDKNLPLLDFEKANDTENGQRVSDEVVLFALKVTHALLKTDYSVQSVRVIDSNTIAAYARNDLLAIFSKNKNEFLQVDSLQQVLARTKIDESKISKIDLRFDKPVIEYK